MDILYVDDDPDLRDLAVVSFELDDGIRVKTVESGMQALKDLEQNQYDVVLLDVMMPNLDGRGVLAKMREGLAPSTPVIFVTARALPEERRELLQLGALEVITKPFDPLQLASDVRTVLRKAG